jgi:hypothetical protein
MTPIRSIEIFIESFPAVGDKLALAYRVTLSAAPVGEKLLLVICGNNLTGIDRL